MVTQQYVKYMLLCIYRFYLLSLEDRIHSCDAYWFLHSSMVYQPHFFTGTSFTNVDSLLFSAFSSYIAYSILHCTLLHSTALLGKAHVVVADWFDATRCMSYAFGWFSRSFSLGCGLGLLWFHCIFILIARLSVLLLAKSRGANKTKLIFKPNIWDRKA